MGSADRTVSRASLIKNIQEEPESTQRLIPVLLTRVSKSPIVNNTNMHLLMQKP